MKAPHGTGIVVATADIQNCGGGGKNILPNHIPSSLLYSLQRRSYPKKKHVLKVYVENFHVSYNAKLHKSCITPPINPITVIKMSQSCRQEHFGEFSC